MTAIPGMSRVAAVTRWSSHTTSPEQGSALKRKQLLPAVAEMARCTAMRYKRAVEKLRILAEACERVKLFWYDTEPFLKAVYVFGEVLDGADPLEAVQVAVAINLPPEEVPWESNPDGTDWPATELRLSKGASCTCGGRTWTRYGITRSAARCASGLSMAGPTSRHSRRWKQRSRLA